MRKKTKSAELSEAILRDFIEEGSRGPGDQLPSVRDLQRHYDASSTGICHALSMLEAQGRIWRRHGKGSFIADPGPAQGRAIGLVLPTNTVADLMMRSMIGVERQCSQANYTVTLGVSGWSYVEERRQVDRLCASGCAAIVVNPVFRVREELAQDYLTKTSPVPLVILDVGVDDHCHSKVLFDNYRAGYGMTRLLLDQGHERVAYMRVYAPSGELLHRSNSERHAGYRAALADAGITARPEDRWDIAHVPGDAVQASLGKPPKTALADTVACLERWKASSAPPTAVICTEDSWAVVTMTEARKLGIAVPEELQVAGFDNLSVGETAHPRFPTTFADFTRAGETAVQLALRHIAGELNEPINYVLPVEVLPREVSRPAPANLAVK